MNERLKEIIDTINEYINDAHGDGYDTVELPLETSRDILSTIKSLQTERDKYREALAKAEEYIRNAETQFEGINGDGRSFEELLRDGPIHDTYLIVQSALREE